MECNEIKTLLSEYLDRTLQSDINRDVKEHLLSCKNCSDDFFLMKSIADELAGLEKIKAPSYLLTRVNQAVTSPSWFSKILDFIPGSGGFKLPMEFVTLATTVALVFLIFSNIQINKSNDVTVVDSNGDKTIINSETNGLVKLNYIPEGNRYAHSSPESLISMGEDRPYVDHEKLVSDLKKMVLLSGGDITLKYARDSGRPEAIKVKIPVKNYGSFIRRAEKIGRFNPPAPSLTRNSPDPVILRISLNLSE